MSVGLYDLDMKTYTQVPANLEIAKLSSYYKGKREECQGNSPYFRGKQRKICAKGKEKLRYPVAICLRLCYNVGWNMVRVFKLQFIEQKSDKLLMNNE